MSSIKRLETSTAKCLSAGQVITSPFSAVKELLENSLDARASAISIEISANTVDVVQVRDNGQGIAPDDRSICCRKHTTSKLSSLDELGCIGGSSLGFRGEALFALAQLAGKMEVTTRVEGESVAVRLEVDQNGEVVKRSIASHQTGTTVRVTDFFDMIPVRKQTTEKSAAKCLASIRKLLQAYVLVRPNVRFNMRVLKSKNEKLNFSYGPKASGVTVHDAAFKVIGTEPASQCSWSVLETGRFEIQALLPTSDAIPTKISNVGHFLSVDNRPMSSSRGFAKQIAKRVVERLRAGSDELYSLKDPFFVMNILCPLGSYDPNVEPEKDDIIFDDGPEVLTAVGELLSTVYLARTQREAIEKKSAVNDSDEVQSDKISSTSPTLPLIHPNISNWHMHSQKRTHPEVGGNTEDMEVMSGDIVANANELEILTTRANIWQSSMYGCDEEDLELFEKESTPQQINTDVEFQKDERDGLNPWTIAKLNALVKPKAAPSMRSIPHSLSRGHSLSSSPSPSRQSYATQNVLPEVRDPSRNTELTPLSWRCSAQEDVPLRGRLGFGSTLNSGQAQAPSMPTPPLSSSPMHEGQLLRRTKAKKSRQTGCEQTVTKSIVQPLRDRDIDHALTPERAKKSKQSQKSRKEGRDLRNLWSKSVSAYRNMALTSHEEPIDIAHGDKQMEDEFRARLRWVSEDLPSQHTHIVLPPQSEGELSPHNLTSACGVWTPINAGQQQIERDVSRLMTKRRRTTQNRRRKSARFPLQLIPDGYQTYHLVQSVSFSPADLESLVYLFENPINELDHTKLTARQYHGLNDALPASTLCSMSLKAIDLLRKQLQMVEQSKDQGAVLAFISTLMRLEKSEEAT